MALPCRVVRDVEGVGLGLLGTFGGEARGLDINGHEECFQGGGGAPQVRPPSCRHVSFADEVTMLGDADSPVGLPEAELLPLILPVAVEGIRDALEPESPSLILPVVVEDSSVAPVVEMIELGPPAMGSISLPPPGFSPFSWLLSDGGIDVDDLCTRIGVNCSPSLSPISRMCVDVSPGVGVLVSPIIDGSSDMAPAVGHAELTLPPVCNCFVKDILWAPSASQEKKPNDDREIPAPVGDYGLPLHHPRFIEWIGVPQSAGFLEIGGAQWVDKLSPGQAVAAAVHLQRDVGLMQTNVDVLDQYALSLQKMASRMIEVCLGSRGFPVEDVAAGALGPRVRRAVVQMEAMGLWRPSLDQLRLH